MSLAFAAPMFRDDVDSYAALRAIPTPGGGVKRKIEVTGREFAGDGAWGTVYWDDSSTETDHGTWEGLVFKPNNIGSGTPGRWKRHIIAGHYDPRWFGVKADGVTDNADALDAVMAASNGGNIVLPAGTINTSRAWSVYRTCVIRGHGGGLHPVTTLKRTTPGPGIVIESYMTSPVGVAGDFSRFKDFRLSGTQPPKWQPLHTYQVGDIVKNVEFRGAFTQLIYELVTFNAPTSSTEPLWPVRGDASTILTGNVAPGDPSVNVNSTTASWPDSGLFMIGSEQISYASKTATTLDGLTRGLNGTTDAAHSTGDLVREIFQDSPHGRYGFMTENTLFTDDVGNVWRCFSAPGFFSRGAGCTWEGVYTEFFAGDAWYFNGYVEQQRFYANLSGDINASVTSIPVASTANLPQSGVLLIDSEQVSYTHTTPTSYEGCTRGVNSTTPASHTNGTIAYPTRYSICTFSSVADCAAQFNHGRAWYSEGTDASTIVTRNLTAQVNDSGGIFDNADIGSTFITCLMEQNGIYFWGPNLAGSLYSDTPAHPTANGGFGSHTTGVTNNGYFYRPTPGTIGGTTGSTEPTWPLTVGATVVDGTVTWQNMGRMLHGQPYMNRNTGLTPSQFLGCYAEPDQVPDEISFPAIHIGASGAGFCPTGTNPPGTGGVAFILSNGRASNGLGQVTAPGMTTPTAKSGLGSPFDNFGGAFVWQAGDDSSPYRLSLSPDSKRWQFLAEGSAVAAELGNTTSEEGAGTFRVPNGFFLGPQQGNPRSQKIQMWDFGQNGAGPPSSIGVIGDIMLGRVPDFGFPLMWVCAASAPGAVWIPISAPELAYNFAPATPVGSPTTLNLQRQACVNTDFGSGTKVGFQLPATPPYGTRFKFNVNNSAAGVRVVASGTDLISYPGVGVSTVTTGYIESVQQDAYIEISAIGGGPNLWVVTQVVGTWTVV